MSKVTGQLLTCDRCGATTFLQRLETKYLDGGYTRSDTYTKAEGWGWTADVGDVCPACMKEYREIIEKFKRRPAKTKEGNV